MLNWHGYFVIVPKCGPPPSLGTNPGGLSL